MKYSVLAFLMMSLCVNAEQYNAVKLSGDITLDGQLSESLWPQASKVELVYENYPGEGIAAEHQTVARIFYDNENLYIGIRAYDDSKTIRANLSDRDDIDRDDSLAVIIDTFNDSRNAYKFAINPLGVQFDAKLNDENGWQEDNSWDGIWFSAAQIDEQGWSAELKIPLRALRFKDAGEPQTWQFAVLRNRPRNVNRQYASYRENNEMNCSLCLFDQLTGLQQLAQGSHFQLTPTLTFARNDTRPEVNGPWIKGEGNNEFGLDLRWGVSGDSVLNATFNPDFSQVEADAAQLAVNNRFALYVREKRAFFLDGAENFATGGQLDLVHTRNIADPDYGVKLTGKNGDHRYGFLVADDAETTFLLPGNQGSRLYRLPEHSVAAVIRYKADVGERSNVGVLTTVRQGEGYRNLVASVDGTYAVNDSHSVQYQYSYADSQNPQSLSDDTGLAASQQDSAFSLDYYHDTRDYNLNLGYSQTGKDFRADMGFVGQADIKTWSLGGRRTYYGQTDDALTRYGYFGSVYINSSEAGEKLSEYYDFRGFVNGPMQSFANFGVSAGNEYYQDQSFDFARLVTYSTITPLPDVELQLFVGYGKHIDWTNLRPGRRLDLQGTLNWQLSKHMHVFFDHTIESIKEKDGYDFMQGSRLVAVPTGTVYTAHQSDLRMTYQFDIKSRLQLTLQYTDIDRNELMYQVNHDSDPSNDIKGRERFFASQLLYSYEVNPQTLVYLGYSDGGFQSGDMSKLHRNNRSIFAKFSYAWQQ